MQRFIICMWCLEPGSQLLSIWRRKWANPIKIISLGMTSLAVQWLRLHTLNAGGMSSIPGQGTIVPHASCPFPPPKKSVICLGHSIHLAEVSHWEVRKEEGAEWRNWFRELAQKRPRGRIPWRGRDRHEKERIKPLFHVPCHSLLLTAKPTAALTCDSVLCSRISFNGAASAQLHSYPPTWIQRPPDAAGLASMPESQLLGPGLLSPELHFAWVPTTRLTPEDYWYWPCVSPRSFRSRRL